MLLNAFLFSQTWEKPELVSHAHCLDEHKLLDKQGESTVGLQDVLLSVLQILEHF